MKIFFAHRKPTVFLLLLSVTWYYSQAQEKFWGLSSASGVPNQNGSIFSIRTDGSNFKTEYGFPAIVNNGAYPGGMVYFNGKLYGTTQSAGQRSGGVIFTYDPATGNYTDEYDFVNETGSNPVGNMVIYNNLLYGVTASGGGLLGAGVIFSYDPVSHTYTNLHSFDGTHGNSPAGSLLLYNNILYGTTSSGGAGSGGTLFSFDPVSEAFTDLYGFKGTDGWSCQGDLVVYNNLLYGLTSSGGANGGGVLFSYDPASASYTNKFDFSAAGGSDPRGGLTVWNNQLWGLTRGGGAGNNGVIFSFDPAAATYTKKYDFDGTHGAIPTGNLLSYNQRLYGMTLVGGANGNGTIFVYDPAANSLSDIVNFDGSNGANPSSNYLLPLNNLLYGVTANGGVSKNGVLFTLDPATGAFRKKIDFNQTNINGMFPNGSLTWFNQKLYGTAGSGGKSDAGVLFSMDPLTGVFTKLYEFDGTHGRAPLGDLIVYNNKLYGVAGGGASNQGVIYTFDPATGTYTDLHDFNSASLPTGGGSIPLTSLIVYSNKLYGLTYTGGAKPRGRRKAGIIYSYDPATGTFLKVFDLPKYKYQSGMVVLNNLLYGLSIDGPNGNGYLYAFDPAAATLTGLFDFDNTHGSNPQSGLTVLNGKLIGMTSGGGANNVGVLFSYDPAAAAITTLKDFSSSDGAVAQGIPLFYNGKLYGLTSGGGQAGRGVIFQYDPGVGTYSRFYDFPTYTIFNPQSTQLVEVRGKILQTINFPPLPPKAFRGADFSPGATSTNPGIPITYTSSNPAVATIAGGMIHIVGGGTAIITASQAGDAQYLAAPDTTQTLTVTGQLAQTISFSATAVHTYGEADFSPGATSSNPGIPIIYTSSDTAIAALVGGKIHLVKPGSAIITASQANDGVYAAASATQTLTVNKAVLVVKADNKFKRPGQRNPPLTISYIGFVNGDDPSKLYQMPGIATTATLASPAGDYPIRVSKGSSFYYQFQYSNGVLTINTLLHQTVSLNAMADKNYGDPDFDPGATSTNSTTPIEYSSNNSQVATVVAGRIHITGAGTAIITAYQAQNDFYYADSVSVPFTAHPAQLTIKADDKTKVQGAANPLLTLTYSGLVNGDDSSVLPVPPLVNTPAGELSPLGQYPIQVFNAYSPNYSIRYLAGTLSILPPGIDGRSSLDAYCTGPGQLLVNIYAPASQFATLQLVDLRGAYLVNQQVSLASGFSSFVLPVDRYATGIYIVRVVTGQGTLAQRVKIK